jgi:hypothetical protein
VRAAAALVDRLDQFEEVAIQHVDVLGVKRPGWCCKRRADSGCSLTRPASRVAVSNARPARATGSRMRTIGSGALSSAVPDEPNADPLASLSGTLTWRPSSVHTATHPQPVPQRSRRRGGDDVAGDAVKQRPHRTRLGARSSP